MLRSTVLQALMLATILGQPTPALAYEQAHADLAKVPLEARADLRYLSLYNVPAEIREKRIKVTSGHVNSLSRETDLSAPTIVSGTRGMLLRINLNDYGWKAEVWEKLVDPRFVATVEIEIIEDWTGGQWTDGKYYAPGAFQVRVKRKQIDALAPWLAEDGAARKRLAEVVEWTQSKTPVVSLDWFVYQTLAQEGRAVGYYDFLALKKQADFEQLVRFDAKLAAKLEHRRAVVFSGIALQPRRIERVATPIGGLWRSFDNEKAADKANPLRILDDDFTFQATEQIGPMPNGLPAFWLADDKGTRQDKAPDQIIGNDRTSQSNDGRIHIGRSCWGCHFGANKLESGVKEADFARIGKLKSPDYRKFLELKRQYTRDIEGPTKRDRESYASAIKQATGGMTPYEFANALLGIYADYEGPVTPARAAADLGTTPAKLRKALEAYDARADLDPVLSILMNGKSIGVVQWEEALPAAHLVLRGLVQP
ncbi:MAG TPA: hypothetical protein VFE62_01620 [Gemmataceae bacterium]|nr:hypothetical protein [Gemmataceae bacterium]